MRAKHLAFCCTAIALLIFLSGCGKKTVSYEVEILDEADGTGVSGAEVKLHPKSGSDPDIVGTTNDQGVARFPKVPPGDYVVLVKKNYNPYGTPTGSGPMKPEDAMPKGPKPGDPRLTEAEMRQKQAGLGGAGGGPTNLLPAEYSDATKEKLTCSVPGDGKASFKIKTKTK